MFSRWILIANELLPKLASWILRIPSLSGPGTKIIEVDANGVFIRGNSSLSEKADLVGGKVPSSQLPSYVDDVIECPTVADLPSIGEQGKIYVITSGIDINKTFRYTGSVYVQIGGAIELWKRSGTTISPITDNDNVNIGTGTFSGKFDAIDPEVVMKRNGQNFLIDRGDIQSLYLGTNAGKTNEIGIGRNLGLGVDCLSKIGSGNNNTAVGVEALRELVDASDNTAIGFAVLFNCSGIGNTAIGAAVATGANSPSQSGNYNVFIGGSMVYHGFSGNNNIFIGNHQPLGTYGLLSGDNNILIGNAARLADVAISNYLNIENTIFGDLLNKHIGIGAAPVLASDKLYLYEAGATAMNVRLENSAGQLTIGLDAAGEASIVNGNNEFATTKKINPIVTTARLAVDYFTEFQSLYPAPYTTVSLGSNTMYAYPFFVTEKIDVKQLVFRPRNTGSVDSHIVAGIYASGDKGTAGDRYVPDTLVKDLGWFTATDSDKSNTYTSGELILEPGILYWFCLVHNSTTAVTVRACQSTNSKISYPSGFSGSPSGMTNHFNGALTYPVDDLMPSICPILTNKVTTAANIAILFFKIY